MNSLLQLSGIGLRREHYEDFLKQPPPVAWLEVHSENYFVEGGKHLHILEKIRRDYPISLHGVSLSIGSADELNWQHLKKLRELITRINPCLVSDHLSWSSVNGQYLHDLLPLPRTEEVIEHSVMRIQQIQEFLQQQILIENISSYIQYQQSEMTEENFISEVAKRSGCGILLDINNIYVNAINFGFDPEKYIYVIPKNMVQEIHLAGSLQCTIDEKEILIDTHNKPVLPAVWNLYRKAIDYLGIKPTMIEWDSDLPSLETLYLEAYRAETILRESYVPTKFTS
jgi:uncharacterized protein